VVRGAFSSLSFLSFFFFFRPYPMQNLSLLLAWNISMIMLLALDFASKLLDEQIPNEKGKLQRIVGLLKPFLLRSVSKESQKSTRLSVDEVIQITHESISKFREKARIVSGFWRYCFL
jgi:hypothetical protein